MTSQPFEGYPLSPIQAHLWRLQQTDGDRPYRVQVVVQLRGVVDRERLQAALAQLVAQHEILRTTYRCRPGSDLPLQVIGDPYQPVLQQYDLSQLAPGPQAEGVDRLVAEARSLPCNQGQGPLLQGHFLTISSLDHLVILTAPAMAVDQAGLESLAHQLFRTYLASDQPQADEPLQYAEVAQWQHDLLEDPEATGYWRTTAPGLLPGSVPFTPQLLAKTISLQVTQLLADSLGVSPQAVLLACWQTLLGRVMEGTPSPLGVAFDGRTLPELAAVPGPCGRVLPIAAPFALEGSFAARVRDLHRQLTEAASWQDAYPIDQAEGRYLPFAFAYRDEAGPHTEDGLTWRIAGGYTCTDRFDLMLSARRIGSELELCLYYDAAQHDGAEADRLLERLCCLLASAGAEPEQAVGSLNLLPDGERQLLLHGFNQTAAPVSESPVHQLIAAQAARIPEQLALVCGAEHLTYAELDQKTNQLAHALQKMGVGPESLVALCLERSPAMLVAILGVLKAGGAYLPLDPNYPAERLAFVLADAGVPLVLTQEHLAGRLPAGQARLFCLDSQWHQAASEPADDPAVPVSPRNLAYVIYTSGSTGQPKGVLVEHGGLTNYLCWAVEAYRVAEGGGAPVHSSLGFDLTVTSLFLPLLAGRTVTLLPDGQGVEVLEALRQGGGYSLVKITPAHLQMLRHAMDPAAAAGWARALVIGGEALTGESLAFWQSHAPATRLINEYGPTETVVGCAVYEVPPGQSISGPVPIGRPIANARLYILDQQMAPVPIGAVGELYIGGAGVARGYLNRPELTAQRFVTDPFDPRGAGRLYRTGDMARYRPDGIIEFLGRRDFQVKIRGYRIELEEIEAAMLQHLAVRESVVTVWEGSSEERRLVAYYVTRGEQRPTAAELREFLAQKLPEYMLPTAFIPLDRLPLTAHGKVDRQALPAPDQEPPSDAYAAPRTPTEERLAAIWAELLGVEQVSVHQNFHDLGGDSILGIQAVSRMRKAFQVDLPVRALFDYPTIAEVAGVVEELVASQLVKEMESLSEAEAAELLKRVTEKGGQP